MINKFFEWTKANKFPTVLIFLLVVFAIYKQYPVVGYNSRISAEMGTDNFAYEMGIGAADSSYAAGYGSIAPSMGVSRPYYPTPINQPAPTPDIKDRKVVYNADVSLQVENVVDSVSQIKAKVGELDGYVVNSNITKPEFGESANLYVRVPSEKLEEFLGFVKQGSVKVVNENISGSDITDQYVDTEERLAQLAKHKAQLQQIMNAASTVEDIMRVKPYLDNLQNEIDNLVGRNKYADAASKMSLVSVYLSTDELSLPYTPDLSWRPQAIFKNAVRSLLITLQKGGSAMIWLGVYSVLIVPAITIVYVIILARRRKNQG